MENIFGLRAHDVLADIKEISHHKNREDGGLSTDQAVHADASTGRETPVEIVFLEVHRYCAHRLLVPPIWILWMLEIPQGTAATHDRNDSVVVHRRRRACGPLECPRIPRIIPRRLASQVRPNQIAGKDEDSGCLKDDADGYEQIPGIPTAAGLIRIDPPGHAQQPRDMHEIKRQVETDEEKPKVQSRERLVIPLP